MILCDNKKIQKKFDILIKELSNYLMSMVDEYDIEKYTYLEFILAEINSEYIKEANIPTGIMFTNLDGFAKRDTDNVEYMEAEIVLPKERLFEILIDCEMDFEKTATFLKFCLKHEIGHIIDFGNKYIGKPRNEWGIYHCDDNTNLLPPLRKNASKENYLKWNLKYHSLPDEKAADEAVGITDNDIIEMVGMLR